MTPEETIGKTITNIYSLIEFEVGGLDSGECFIELDGKTIIGIPYSAADNDLIKTLNKKAVNIFSDLSDYPVYHVNKEGKTVGEIAESNRKRQATIFYKLRNLFFAQGNFPKEYRPYKVEYRENELKNLKGQRITDFIWYPDDTDKGFFLLENNYLITETLIAPHGTGLAGLNYFDGVSALIKSKGSDYLKLTQRQTNPKTDDTTI